MRRLFPIIFVLFSLSAFGQFKLRGTFCDDEPSFSNQCFTFKNDSLFDYLEIGCKGEWKGSGKYILEDKSTGRHDIFTGTLTLNFIKDDSITHTPTLIIKDTICSMEDSVSLKFLLREMPGNYALPAVTIWLIDLNNDTIITLTDIDGKASLKVINSKEEFKIITSAFGFKSFSFKTKLDTCKNIQIMLVPFDNIVENGTVWKYKIKADPDKVILNRYGYDERLVRQKK